MLASATASPSRNSQAFKLRNPSPKKVILSLVFLFFFLLFTIPVFRQHPQSRAPPVSAVVPAAVILQNPLKDSAFSHLPLRDAIPAVRTKTLPRKIDKLESSSSRRTRMQDQDTDKIKMKEYTKKFGPATWKQVLAARQDRVDRLLTWCFYYGCELNPKVSFMEAPKIRVDQPDQNFGLYALEDLTMGEQLFYVPTVLQLTAQRVLPDLIAAIDPLTNTWKSQFSEKLAKSGPPATITPQLLLRMFQRPDEEYVREESPLLEPFEGDVAKCFIDVETFQRKLALALFIMFYREDVNHFFYPYLASMPIGCQNYMCWSDEFVKATLSSAQIAQLKHRRNCALGISRLLGLDEEIFTYALSLVSSRTWAHDDNAMMVPVADMLNHNIDGKGARLRLRDNGSQLNLAIDTPKGGEIFDSYGGKDNGALLVFYGFTIPENPHDNCKTLRKRLSEGYVQRNYPDCVTTGDVMPAVQPPVQK